jgi:2-oxoglutarate ferredoxin oxidoreductase subunit delta
MAQVLIDRDRCKGCELCTHYCPQNILEMSKEINVKGYFFSRVIDQSRCIGCRICAIICPDTAIEIHTHGAQYQLFEY